MIRSVSFLVVYCLISVFADQRSRVATSDGTIIGIHQKHGQRSVTKFLGVPYAKPPVGWLRFRSPQPVDENDNEIDATELKPSCMQSPHLLNALHPVIRSEEKHLGAVSEDCLYINVYVPGTVDEAQDLPVIVWIPGEGFDFAKANQFDGSELALTSNSIVVTVNYRVSIFGFFSTGDHHVPGNMGLLDQRMALKWIQKNIESFGGDASKVTLSGRFTGSMSIGIHLVSSVNKNQNLFHRAIMQSGVITGSYIFGNDQKNGTARLAKAVDCERKSISETVKCLRNVKAEELLSKAMSVHQVWAPVIDGHYLVEDPMDAIKHGRYNKDVNVIMGVNSDEGSICLLMHRFLQTPYYQKILSDTLNDEDFTEMAEANIKDYYKDYKSGLTELVNFEYSKSCKRSHKNSKRSNYVDFCGDMYVKSSKVEMADALTAQGTKVWLYEFHHRPSSSIYPSFISAAHGDDVLFSLGLIKRSDDVTSTEVSLSDTMMKTWGRFAQSGVPKEVNGISWPKYSTRKRSYLRWTAHFDMKNVRHHMRQSYVTLWNEVIAKLV